MEKHIIAIRYGLIWSAVYVVLTMALYLFDHTMIQNFGVGIVLFLIGIVFMYFSGMANIRDVIPFPRTPKNAEF